LKTNLLVLEGEILGQGAGDFSVFFVLRTTCRISNGGVTKMGNYTLSGGVYFFAGAKRGAIYDTNTGKVYSVNSAAKQIIEGASLDNSYWQQLVGMGLASTNSDNCKVLQALPKHQENLRFVWFEIVSDACNNCCIHCYAKSGPVSRRRCKTTKLTYSQWVSLIDQSVAAGCKRCQLIGGEPFLYRGEQGESVLDLAEHARKVGFEVVEIFTNATLLTSENVARIKELELRVAVSLYSNEPDIHDTITRRRGSYIEAARGLRILKDAGVNTRVELILMRANQDTLLETLSFIKEFGFGETRPDPIRQVGRGSDLDLLPEFPVFAKYGLRLKPDFKTSLLSLARNLRGNPCLNGKIAITDVGVVYPCIFSRSFSVGSVLEDAYLENIIQGDGVQRVWYSSKDAVVVCKDCEFRYCCADCKPLAEARAFGKIGYFEAPYPRCTYNPYTGEWAGGVWKVDSEGGLCYDESVKPILQSVTSGV